MDGLFPSARASLVRAIELLRDEGDPVALARALRALGEVERALPESDGGIAAYEEAIAILRHEPQPLLFAHTIRHLGDIYRHHGNTDRSARCYGEALALYREPIDPPALDVANALRGAALLKEATGARTDAIALWNEAKDLYLHENADAGATEAARHIRLLETSTSD